MLYNPKWRQHSPEKWMDKEDFILPTKAKVETKFKPSKKNRRALSTKTEPYIDGLNAVGDRKISRDTVERNQGKMFSSVIPRDTWQERSKQCDSIRAAKALEIILSQNPNSIVLNSSYRSGSPRRGLNKDLAVKTYEYKVYTMNEANKVPPTHFRSSSTGKLNNSNRSEQRLI